MAIVADFLTAFRFVIALVIIFLGFQFSETGFRLFIFALLAGWTTDIIDGKLARRSTTTTNLGPYDFFFDVFMVLSSAVYLSLSGFISPNLLIAYIIVLAGSSIIFRSSSIVMLLICPFTFLPFYLSLTYDRTAFYVALAWALTAFYFERARFYEVIAEFAEEFPGEKLGSVQRFFSQLAEKERYRLKS